MTNTLSFGVGRNRNAAIDIDKRSRRGLGLVENALADLPKVLATKSLGSH